jgi:hypothetical protein
MGRQRRQRFVHLWSHCCRRFLGFLAPAGHQRLVAGHAEDALRRAGIAQVLDLALAVAAAETVGAEGLVARQDGQVLDLVTAMVAAVCTIVTNQRAVAQQQQVRIRVEQRAARVAAEAIDMPSVPRCLLSVSHSQGRRERGGPLRGKVHTELKGLSFFENLAGVSNGRCNHRSNSTSPHPLHGYTTSSCSEGDSGYAPGDSMLLWW